LEEGEGNTRGLGEGREVTELEDFMMDFER